ncbi:MAG: hypothetical protein FJ150_02725 [Euryarchaeota archaeon]|nr:hypothetical protein [Euryarchaeota archaeon]
MRKLCIFSIVFTIVVSLMVTFSFAQTSREGTSSEGKTTFTNIAVVGLNKDGTDDSITTGVPGYIEMVSSTGSKFYLWIGADSKLHIASQTEVGYLASPATVGWSDASGPIVGGL